MATTFESTLLYKCFPPGTSNANPGNGGRTFKTAPAKTQGEADLLAKDGWFPSMAAAEEAYDLAKSPEDPGDLPSTATPEERAAAADALQADAAEKLNEANQNLAADQVTFDAADKDLQKVLEEYEEATEAKKDFDAKYADLLGRKAAAQVRAQEAGKTLSSSKLRTQAADRALDDAATKVITMGSLLTNAKKKALDAAAAKQKALAAAEKKDAAPKEDPTLPPVPPVLPTPPEPTPDPTITPVAPLPDLPSPAAGQPGVRTKKAL
jgi:hypothetical protein